MINVEWMSKKARSDLERLCHHFQKLDQGFTSYFRTS